MTMNKAICIAILGMAAATSATGCTSTRAGKNDSAPEGEKTFALKDFKKNSAGRSVVRVHFTQADKYSVEVRTVPADIMEYVGAEVRGDVLVLDFDGERYGQAGRNDRHMSVDAYVSAPKLEQVKMAAASKFTAGKISADDIDFVLSGASNMNISQLTAKEVNLNVSGAAKCTLGKVECSEAGFVVAGAAKMIMDVEADNLSINNSGAVSGTVKFKGDRIDLVNSGACKMDVSVDCKTLHSNNAGASKVKLSGTADETKIETTGVAKTDTSGLNKL